MFFLFGLRLQSFYRLILKVREQGGVFLVKLVFVRVFMEVFSIHLFHFIMSCFILFCIASYIFPVKMSLQAPTSKIL